MNRIAAILALAMLAACSRPAGESNAPASPEAGAPASATQAAPMSEAPVAGTTAAAASGTVEAIDTSAKTITIAHGPVDALEWPAMTMTFRAPDADLASFREGDRVAFEFTSSGMEATITGIERQP